MRFHPKRRASMDHRPGPNIARAAAAVPNSNHTHLSPAIVSIFQISINAMEVPTIGVHKPTISSIPAPIKSTAGIVTFIGGRSFHSLKLVRTTSAEPTTKRMSSKPVPGQPPANVEYRRRKDTPFALTHSDVGEADRNPKRSAIRHCLEFCIYGALRRRAVNYSSMIPLFNPIIAACVRSLAPNFEKIDLTRLLTVSSVIES
jgi:hypothetical protein